MAPSARMRDLVGRAAATRQMPAIGKCRSRFGTRLLHAAPHAPLRQRTRSGRDATVVFFLQAQEGFHCQLALGSGQLNLIRVQAAGTQVTG